MSQILVAYGSKYGATAEIAEAIDRALEASGLEADVQRARSVRSLDGYCAAVIGSAVYAAHWRGEALRFLGDHRDWLSRHPVWVFSSGPVGEDEEDADEAETSDVMGMTADLRRQADWLASVGYLAVAPDLFFRGGRVSCLRTIFRDALRGRGQTFDDIEASRAWLADRNDCTGRVGVIGFCMGGGFALMVVAGHGFSVASTNYGTVPKDFERFVSRACPVIGSYGARDRSLRGPQRSSSGCSRTLEWPTT